MKKRASKKESSKVVILLGSPRSNGNTAALAAEIDRGASAVGAKVKTFHLHKMKIASCAACQRCHGAQAKGCVIRDDMDMLYPALNKADAIVFASPIYWFNMTAQLKQALDRCYALCTADGGHRFAGKRIGLAFTFGGEDVFDSGCINVIRSFQDIFNYIKTPITGMVYGSSASGPIATNKPLMREARNLGKILAGSD